ncbi:MAG: OmpA family protein [Treponema sp.]|nr:OmpA family protein [Treponema sp.]
MIKIKMIVSLVLAVFCFCTVAACVGQKPAGENPMSEPEVSLEIPELFSPDPDIADDVMIIGISVNHPVPVKEWQIQVQPNRRQSGQQAENSGQRQRTGGQQAENSGQRQRAGQRQQGEAGQRQRRGPFFGQTGRGQPPEEWKWNGKGTSGEMVQSATDYLFSLTVSDDFGNTSVTEGIISVDIIVRKEGDIYKMVVPSIVFPGNSADLTKVTEEEARNNRRVLGLIGRALNRFADYQITVEGHSNPLTPPNTPQRTAEEKDDQALSEQRAQSVANYLADNSGIGRSRLKVLGRSCTRPVADYEDEDENWKNRRVEFILAK